MRNGKLIGFAATAVCGVALAGCAPMSGDRYGIYVNGDNYIVVDHDRRGINFTTDTQATPEALLADAVKGKGLSFTVWRNKTSCGLHDSRGNNFVVPRGASSLGYGGATFVIDPPSTGIEAANDGRPPHGETIRMRVRGQVRMTYVYDDTLGVRSIDWYDDGDHVTRTLVLSQGTGLLEHCRGFSLDDYKT